MIFIQHRKNSVAELEASDPRWGIEIDIRSNTVTPSKLHLAHDPWTSGCDFNVWLEKYKAMRFQGPLILNTKEDGLEDAVLKQMRLHHIENFIFLDTTIPTLVKWHDKQLSGNFFVRASKYEPVENALTFSGIYTHLWVDCFHGVPLNLDIVRQLKPYFKLCLVSPELHGYATDRIKDFSYIYHLTDFICTKVPQEWQKLET